MKTFDQTLVGKYLKNECSKEEAKMVVAWFKTREGQEYLKLNLDRHLEEAEESSFFMLDHEIRSEEIFQKISYLKDGKTHSYRPVAYRKWLKVASSAAAVIFLAAIYLFLFNQDNQKLTYVDTPYGSTKTVQLPDGSTVILNANSRLAYDAEGRAQGNREVWLEGEAFFSVTHTVDDQRFIVHANQVDVEVLGTEFNVKNRRSKTQIVLNTGKVKLTANIEENEGEVPSAKDGIGSNVAAEKVVIMQPGELVEFSEETRQFETKIVSPEKYSAWVGNEWVFDQSSLGEAIRMLEDFYGYEIVLSDRVLEDSIFTARISSNEIDVLLEIIAESFELKVTKQQNAIVLIK